MLYFTQEKDILALRRISREYDCKFENRKITKIFLTKSTTERDIHQEYIIGEKFQAVILSKGKIVRF